MAGSGMKIHWRWLIEAAFCWPTMMMSKNDNESQVTASMCFHIRALMQRNVLVRFACAITFVTCNMFRRQSSFQLSTLNRNAFFRVELTTRSVTIVLHYIHTKRITELYSPDSVAGARPPMAPLRLFFLHTLRFWPNPPVGQCRKDCERETGVC